MTRVELEREVGGDKKTFNLKEGDWVYWTKLPDSKDGLRFEYLVTVRKKGAIISWRTDRSRPFRPVGIEATNYGNEVKYGEPGDHFSLKVFSEE